MSHLQNRYLLKTFIVSLTIPFIGVSFGQGIPKTKNISDWESMNLNGKVKLIKETTETYLGGQVLPGLFTSLCYSFNNQGYLSKTYNCDDNTVYNDYIYNDQMQLVKSVTKDELLAWSSESEFKYDNNGDLVEIIDYEKVGSDTTFTRKSFPKYNDKGFITEYTVTIDDNSEEKGLFLIEYNDNNEVIKFTVLAGEKVIDTSIIKYDDKGNIIEMQASSADSPSKTLSEYNTLDSHSNWTSRVDVFYFDEDKPSGKAIIKREISYFDE